MIYMYFRITFLLKSGTGSRPAGSFLNLHSMTNMYSEFYEHLPKRFGATCI